jgi:hypothetical protein
VPWLVVTAAAFIMMVLFSAPATSPTTAKANAAVCTDNPTNGDRIKPYKCEHNQGRYPSGSTGGPVTVPCSMPTPWPSSVMSCFGPEAAAAAPAPAPAAAPPPAPAAAPAAAPPPAGGGGQAAPAPQNGPKAAPSCG